MAQAELAGATGGPAWWQLMTTGYPASYWSPLLQWQVKPKKEWPQPKQPATQPATAPAPAPAPAPTPTEPHWTQQPWAGAYIDALAGLRREQESAPATPAQPKPYNPWADPRFATLLTQLQQAVGTPFEPKLEEHPRYQAEEAALQRLAEEQASRAVQQMAARGVLRSSMTEEALGNIARDIATRLRTEIAPQVYQQLLSERQANIQNLLGQLQAAMGVAQFGSEEERAAVQSALQAAQLQEAARQFQAQQAFEQWQALLPWAYGLTPYQERTLTQQAWEAQLPWTMGMTPYQRAQIGLERESLAARQQRELTDQLRDNLLARIQTQGYESLSEDERLLAQALLGIKPQVSDAAKAEAFQGWIQAVRAQVRNPRDVRAVRAWLTSHLAEIVASGLTIDDVARIEQLVTGQ